MSFEINQEFINELEELVQAGNKEAYLSKIEGLHPADIA